MNRVTLCGRFSKNIELRYTNSKKAVLSNSLAVNRNFKNDKGEIEADFINVIAFDKKAELIEKYCKKGDKILVNGRLSTRNYENDKGVKQYVTEVIIDELEFIQPIERNSKNDVEVKEQIKEEIKDDPFAEFGKEVQLSDEDLPF